MAALRNGDVASCSRLLLLLRSVWGLFKPYRQALGEVKKHISYYSAQRDRRLPHFLLSSEAESSSLRRTSQNIFSV